MMKALAAAERIIGDGSRCGDEYRERGRIYLNSNAFAPRSRFPALSAARAVADDARRFSSRWPNCSKSLPA